VGVEDGVAGKSNYLNGHDRSNWLTNIPQFGKLRYRAVAPGVDAVFYGQGGRLEYDLIIAGDAPDASVAVAFEGAKSIRLDEKGDLVLEVAGGEFRQTIPDAYQWINGQKRHVNASAAVYGNTVQITAASYDRRYPVYVDPVMVYSTYLGGAFDLGVGIRADASGNAYVVSAAAVGSSEH